MDATSGAAAVWWWIGIAVLYLVVIPLVVYLAHRLLRAIREIRRYSEHIREHGLRVAGNLEPVPELQKTRDLIRGVGPKLGEYGETVERLL